MFHNSYRVLSGSYFCFPPFPFTQLTGGKKTIYPIGCFDSRLNKTDMTMKRVTLLFFFSLGVFTFQACSSESKKNEDSVEQAEDMNEANEPTKDDDDAEFAVKAASGGMMEVELGRLAQQKAQSQAVKDFGAMMVEDHSKANEELKTLATSKNIILPSTMGEDHQKHVDELSKLSGAEFDKKYVKMMVDDHKEDIDHFKEAADDAKDMEIKAFAAKTLPTLQKHYDAIKNIDKAM